MSIFKIIIEIKENFFEYKDLDQLNKIIDIIKSNY